MPKTPDYDLSEIVEENDRRRRALFADYDPISGREATGARFELSLDGERTWYVPETMAGEELVRQLQKAGSLTALADVLGISTETVEKALRELRFDHDFEFWSALCVRIETKIAGIQPFILNRPQRKLLRTFEADRMAFRPIRVVLLKARQWGGSTLTQIYMAWIQQRHKRHWNSFICAMDKGQAVRIRAMLSVLASKYPADVGTITLKPYEGGSNVKWIPERECILGVASVERPDAVRSYTYQMLHLSEVGLWPSTEVVNAESFAQGLAGALVDAPYTFCVLESTAKGVGNFFHRMWQRAAGELRGKELEGAAVDDPKQRYRPVFVAWFESHEYYTELAESPESFVASMGEYDWLLWQLGATLEQIYWYQNRRQEPGMDDEWRMKSEYPSTADEAFQSSGRRFFPKAYVLRGRETCERPPEVGNLYGDANVGEESLENLHFEPGLRGFLRVWTRPRDLGVERPGYTYVNRYCIFGDVGGTTEKADFSYLKVIDRVLTIWGGIPYVCAVWHGHLDQDLFAWEAARLARWYDDALLAIEINSLRKDHGDEVRGRDTDHSYTVLDEIREVYDNLFYSTMPEKDFDRYSGKLGFHTNVRTKPIILNALKAGLRDGLYEEKEFEAMDECDMYEIKPDGSFGAVEGQHDDRVMGTAGAVWLATKYMDPVAEVPIKHKKQRRRAGAAEF